MLIYQERVLDVLHRLETSEQGLTPRQVKERLDKHGANVIKVQGEPWWVKVVEPFRSIFMLVLAAAAVVSLFNHEPLDAVIITATILISAIIYYVQRFSTSRVLRALRRHNLQMVEVIRGGKAETVSSDQLVPGDIVLIHEGEKIPADARLVRVSNLRCDESMLTGESVPVSKQAHPLEGDKEVYDRTNIVFQGSFAVAGEATAVVYATGNQTEFGQLAKLSQHDSMESPVQQKIDHLVSRIIGVTAGITVIIFFLSLWRGIPLAEAIRFALSLAVSAVPEGLPVAISVVLVLGMHRMAKRKALVRSMRAIEDVGIVTTIATDKTGTLTENKLTVQDVWTPKGADRSGLARQVMMAVNASAGQMHDPLDSAMRQYAEGEVALRGYALKASVPFEHSFAMSGNVWSKGKEYEVVLKGAPEQVMARCGLGLAQTKDARAALHALTEQGFRVVALAEAKLPGPILSFAELPETGLKFGGFLAVADVLRREARAAVATARGAGIHVLMVTGDHFETAYSIGRQIGMADHRDQVFDSREMDAMSDQTLAKAVRSARVFSRVIPESKYRLLSILKKHEITAMTGDGVNDVPALTMAHVGVAMGSGSQIAREAGDIVLLDNNFKSIVEAVREGRVIFSNIRRMLFYLLATNSGEVLTMIGALLAGMPLPVAAVQILWINLVTDTTMVIPLGLEPGEKNVMKTKPRDPGAPILDRFLIVRIALMAATMAAITLATFYVFLQFTSVEYARTIAFSVLVVSQWANALNARSETESIFSRLGVVNAKLYAGLAVSMLLQAAVFFGPLQHALHVVPVSLAHLLASGVAAAVIPIAVCEVHKALARRQRKSQATYAAGAFTPLT